ncbi:MAG: IS5 family transposase [Acidaminococcaceae bacterium]|nr:IS5 family transposase [Acidaminococcaceae bacterium]
MGQLSFWDESRRLDKLSELGDCLVKLQKAINWNIFVPTLKRVFRKSAKGPGGRPPYDYLMMFKILVLQRIYNLSDDQTEYQINDRMSFMRFLGLRIEDKVPDAKTIWAFRNALSEAGVMRELFDLFQQQLHKEGLITRTGTIVDASFVEAPVQRNSKEERAAIKNGEIPEEWQGNANKLRQKDTDARWTKKNGRSFFGYKDHVKADAESKLIEDYRVSDAALNDSKPMPEMITEEDKVVYADSAYDGKPVAEAIPKNVENKICKQGRRGRKLTDEEKERNREYSKIRCRIEHIFGFMTGSMNGLTLRSIGMARAEFNIGLTNLIYNMFRYEFLHRPKKAMA